MKDSINLKGELTELALFKALHLFFNKFPENLNDKY